MNLMLNIIHLEYMFQLTEKFIFGSESGNSITFTEIQPEEEISGYLVIDKTKIPGCKIYPNEVRKQLKNGSFINAEYVHRMVVYTHGDCNGNSFLQNKVIDHIDMNKKNNKIENLELVSTGINLFRAYDKTVGEARIACLERLDNYYNSLKTIEKNILEKEIDKEIFKEERKKHG